MNLLHQSATIEMVYRITVRLRRFLQLQMCIRDRCSSYVLEYLSNYFEITVFYYNPNIYPETEYTKRILEQQKLIDDMNFKYPVSFVAGEYEKEKFYEMARGLEAVSYTHLQCRLRQTVQYY